MEASTLAPAGLVKVRADGGRGSGWAVGDTGILTARHLLVRAPDAQPGHCWAVLDFSPGGPGFECEVVFEDKDRDLALLRVLDRGAAAWRSRRAARQTVLAEPGRWSLDVEVIGFPEAALDEDLPHPEHVTASLLPAGGAVSGQMPLDVTSSVPEARRGWKGMSGAGVCDRTGRRRLVGIVTSADAYRQQRRLHAAVLPDPAADGAFAAALRQVGAAEYLEDARALEARGLLELLDAAGRPYAPRRVPLDGLGVRFARDDFIQGRESRYYPYSRRLVDRMLDDALDKRAAGADTRVLMLEGNAMAGKSRSLAEAVCRHPTVSTWPLLKPRPGVPLDEVIGFADGDDALVWLDDRLDSVSPDQLRRLLRPRLAIVATVRPDQRARLGDIDETLIQEITVPAELDEQERLWLRDHDPEPALLRVLEGGQSIGEALCAAREMIQRLEQPPGDRHRALTDLIADWPATGIPAPLPDGAAMFLWSSYLPGASGRRLAGMSGEDLKAVYEEVVEWLCEPVAGPEMTIVKRKDGGLVIDGLFQQRRNDSRRRDHVTIPREVYEIALAAAGQGIDPDDVMLNVAARAAAAGWTSITPGARNPLLTETGNHDSTSRWKAIADLFRNPAHIIIRAPSTVHAGTAITVLVAGRMLRTADVEGARIYADCVTNYKYWTWTQITRNNKAGGTDRIPIRVPQTGTSCRRVGVHEFLAPGSLTPGQAFAELAEFSIPMEAIGPMQTTAVNVSWKITAELLTQGGVASAEQVVNVIPAVRIIPASPTVTREKVAALSFSGLPDGPLYPGDQFHGKLIIHAQRDFVAQAITISLCLRVQVHMPDGHTATYGPYKVHRQKGRLELRSGRSIQVPFSGTIPSPIPAASVESASFSREASFFSARKVSFSAQWYLEGVIRRRGGTKATIKTNITVARERPRGLTPPGRRQPPRGQQRETRRRGEQREALHRRLADFSIVTEPRRQGDKLAEALSDLFALEGIPVTDGFAPRDNIGESGQEIGALADVDGQLFLVDARWQEAPLDVSDISGHLVRVYGQPDVNGLMISAGGYTERALAECRRALANRIVIMAEIRELVLLLERDSGLRTWLAAKLHAATAEGNPFHLPIPGQP